MPSNDTYRTVAQLPRHDVWWASELAVSRATTCSTGHDVLDVELPNQGWPRSSLIELLLQQSGIGEMQLLKPALACLAKTQRIALVHPPYIPHTLACKAWGLDIKRLLWLDAKSSADALWSTEQILKSGGCGAVILWQSNVRNESLRRLNLAAQGTDTWFWFMRPLSCIADASPSPLRIALRPAVGGVSLHIVKRRGPQRDTPLFLPLDSMPAGKHVLDTDHAPNAEHPSAVPAARITTPALV